MNQVIGFFGGDSQTGTTMVAWSFAEALAAHGCRVLMVFGSGNDDGGFLGHKSKYSIDDLQAAFINGHLDQDELMQCLEKKKNLWQLSGTRNSLETGHFPGNTFDILMKAAGNIFDYVVIDGGSSVRDGLTVSALDKCQHRYFVITQQPKAIHRYLQNKKRVYAALDIQGVLIINKYIGDPALLLARDIEKMVKEEGAITIPYIHYAMEAEIEGKNLLAFPQPGKVIKRMAADFLPEKKKEKKWKKHSIWKTT